MGWQTPLTGEVRMTAVAAGELLSLSIDWSPPGATFGEYLGAGVAFDDARGVLRFDLGWSTWRLPPMMDLVAAMKDVRGVDRLVHRGPTYNAWYQTGTFFVEPGRWAYVGAGPMLDLQSGGSRRPVHVGPKCPGVRHVRKWNSVGPLARAARPSQDGVFIEVETVRGETFRCGIWALPQGLPLTDEVLVTVAPTDGGVSLRFTVDGREETVPVRELYEERENR